LSADIAVAATAVLSSSKPVAAIPTSAHDPASG